MYKSGRSTHFVFKIVGYLYFENPELLDVLKNTNGLSDIFGQQGHACQAEELWRIKNARNLIRTQK